MLLGDQLCVASMSFANHLQGWIPKKVRPRSGFMQLFLSSRAEVASRDEIRPEAL
ncbi:hypothetical protein Rifp1Sym_dr00060 [endosymbiont of Riftia pachyptila (vent Ph05)]|uniref:Uncharacterized protein n=1 Tax=endosymbiont of Riftia pachyptila (vent Ph05) TaxID=1048808 RepID=G2DGL7_9GAMM|nr:hypothetical protein Rifp1Sym_dr00060 [endosymbiont of Riftia pachyptila (vent Ph05)]